MHKNQSHRRLFLDNCPGKTQCGKTGAADEGFINLQQQLLFTRNDFTEKLKKTPETFPLRPSNTLETLHPSASACVGSASLFLRCLLLPLHHLLLDHCLLLNPPSSSTLQLPLKSISSSLKIKFPWDIEYLSMYLQMTLKSSLILFLLMNRQPRLSP